MNEKMRFAQYSQLAALFTVLLAMQLTGRATADIPVTGIAVDSIHDPTGYDLISYWDSITIGWAVKMVNWDPGYSPTGQADANGNPVNTTIATGTSPAGSDDEPIQTNYDALSHITAYYVNSGDVAYLYRNANQRNSVLQEIRYTSFLSQHITP